MQKLQGWVELGNTVLTISGGSGTISQVVQGSFPGATVTVYKAIDDTLATLYSDDGVTPKANPFTSNVDGSWFFYAADDNYNIRFSGGGIPSPFTLGDAQAFDAGSGGGSSLGYYNVLTLGATGDGSTNDTSAIQAVINTAIAAGGGTIYFPPPTVSYKITTALTVTGGTNINLVGSSLALIDVQTDVTSALIIDGGSSYVNVSGFHFRGYDHGDEGGHGYGAGVIVGNYTPASYTQSQINIFNNKISRFNHSGIMIYAAQDGTHNPANTYISVYNNDITDCQNGVFAYKNCSYLNVYNNSIDSTWYDGIVCDTFSIGDPYTSVANSHIKITNNFLYNIGTADVISVPVAQYGIILKGINNEALVNGNTVSHVGVPTCGSCGIAVTADGNLNVGSNVTIEDNSVDTTNNFGIYCSAADRVRITGNAVSDSAGSGIAITGADNARVADNDIGSCLTSINIATNVTNLSVSDNNIHDSGQFGIYTAVTGCSALLYTNNVISDSTTADYSPSVSNAMFTELGGGTVKHAITGLYYTGSAWLELKSLTSSAVSPPTVTGARDETEGALKNLLSALNTLGIITDSTTAS